MQTRLNVKVPLQTAFVISDSFCRNDKARKVIRDDIRKFVQGSGSLGYQLPPFIPAVDVYKDPTYSFLVASAVASQDAGYSIGGIEHQILWEKKFEAEIAKKIVTGNISKSKLFGMLQSAQISLDLAISNRAGMTSITERRPYELWKRVLKEAQSLSQEYSVGDLEAFINQRRYQRMSHIGTMLTLNAIDAVIITPEFVVNFREWQPRAMFREYR